MGKPSTELVQPPREVPIPDGVPVEDGTGFAASAAKLLKAQRDELGLPDLQIRTVQEFHQIIAAHRGLKHAEKITITNQAILLFRELYPHLTFKQKLYEFARPLEHLTELLHELEARDLEDQQFHARMVCCFSFVVDPHTTYGLPEPYLGAVAFLPFQIRAYRDHENFPRFIVKRVMKIKGKAHEFFVPGAEITHWNGSTTAFYVENSHGRLPAGNYRARISRGAVFATVRPLTYCLIPSEAANILHYIPPGSTRTHAITFPWTIATGMESRISIPRSSFSVSESTRKASDAAHMMMQREQVIQQRLAAGIGGASPFRRRRRVASQQAEVDLLQVSVLSKVFTFQHTDGKAHADAIDPKLLRDPAHPDAKFGYIRILNFGGESTRGMVFEFRRILTDVMNRHAPNNLIIDMRDNPGGDVNAAEQMLQMLTQTRIQPINFQMANTGPMRSALSELKKLRDQKSRRSKLSDLAEVHLKNAVEDLGPWIDSVDEAQEGDVLGAGRALTSSDEANEIGQVYKGFVVLLVDAMSYSAADIFASGFQDHNIGVVIGVDPNTGGGGANVWSHDDLIKRLPRTPELEIQALPGGVTMTLAIRRCTRVKQSNGTPLEDVGVQAFIRFDPTSAGEVLDGFVSLIQRVCGLMGIANSAKLKVRGHCVRTANGVRVTLDVEGVELLEFLDDHNSQIEAVEVTPGPNQTFTIRAPRDCRSLQVGGAISVLMGHGVAENVWVTSTGVLHIASEAAR